MAAGDVDIVPAVQQPRAYRWVHRKRPDPVAAANALVVEAITRDADEGMDDELDRLVDSGTPPGPIAGLVLMALMLAVP